MSIFSRIKLCVGFCKSCNSQLFWLMFFEPLSIGFETLQVLQPRLWEVSPPYLFLIYNDLALSKKSALHLMFKGGGAYKCQLEMLKILWAFTCMQLLLLNIFNLFSHSIFLAVNHGAWISVVWHMATTSNGQWCGLSWFPKNL